MRDLICLKYTKPDVSDQMASYHSAVRKSIRWFHKLAVEFLMGTAVVNALVMYNQHC